jgi:hypothetical protein
LAAADELLAQPQTGAVAAPLKLRLGLPEHDEALRVGQIQHEILQGRVAGRVVADDHLFKNVVGDRVQDGHLPFVVIAVDGGLIKEAQAFVILLTTLWVGQDIKGADQTLKRRRFDRVIKEQIGVAELGLRVVGLFQLRKTAAALDAEYVVKCLRHSPLW